MSFIFLLKTNELAPVKYLARRLAELISCSWEEVKFKVTRRSAAGMCLASAW